MSKVSNSGDSKKRKGESERRDDVEEGGCPHRRGGGRNIKGKTAKFYV